MKSSFRMSTGRAFPGWNWSCGSGSTRSIRPWATSRSAAICPLIRSRVDIAPSELVIIRALDPNAADTRKLQGQSPYVVNIDAMYDNTDTGTLVSVHYNVFGERLSEVSTGGTPNAFEQPAGMLDITGSQRLSDRVTLKFSAKNLLDPDIKKVHTFNSEDFIRSLYKRGRTFSIGFSYGI